MRLKREHYWPRLAIVGSRGWEDTAMVWLYINSLKPRHVISGGAAGADSIAARFCRDHDIPLTEHLPEWDKYGKKAGYIRNQKIVDDADAVLAFVVPDADGNITRGTLSTLKIAARHNKPAIVVFPDGREFYYPDSL